MGSFEARLDAIVRASPRLMQVLEIARDLDLPEWRVVSGAVYQTVWNALTGREPDYGVKDYDLFYFDASDLSYEAEDVVIKRAAAAYPPELSPLVEVRNQARVHLWFEAHFGEPYAPLTCSDEAISRFVSSSCALGVRLENSGRPAGEGLGGSIARHSDALAGSDRRRPADQPVRVSLKTLGAC